jgi:hypothetical protein
MARPGTTTPDVALRSPSVNRKVTAALRRTSNLERRFVAENPDDLRFNADPQEGDWLVITTTEAQPYTDPNDPDGFLGITLPTAAHPLRPGYGQRITANGAPILLQSIGPWDDVDNLETAVRIAPNGVTTWIDTNGTESDGFWICGPLEEGGGDNGPDIGSVVWRWTNEAPHYSFDLFVGETGNYPEFNVTGAGPVSNFRVSGTDGHSLDTGDTGGSTTVSLHDIGGQPDGNFRVVVITDGVFPAYVFTEIFRIDNDGSIHGKSSVGAITWDL